MICKSCNNDKPLEFFHFRMSRQGHKIPRNECKICRNSRERQRFYGLTEQERKIHNRLGTQRRYAESHPFYWIMRHCKARAKKRGWANNISDKFLQKLWEKQGGLCALTGEPMVLEIGNPSRVSLDRINPKLGYTKRNVRLVKCVVNLSRRSMTDVEFLQMCKSVVNYMEKESD